MHRVYRREPGLAHEHAPADHERNADAGSAGADSKCGADKLWQPERRGAFCFVVHAFKHSAHDAYIYIHADANIYIHVHPDRDADIYIHEHSYKNADADKYFHAD